MNRVDLSLAEDVKPRNEGTSSAEMEDKYFRFIQFHRHLEIHERFMLHPGILDVLEVLVGPDVMTMQSMLFLKPPGKPGQAYHQDSFYIDTAPDTLCGAWIAIDDCDEENGCMSAIPGSNLFPVFQNVSSPESTDDFQEGLTEVVGVGDMKEAFLKARA